MTGQILLAGLATIVLAVALGALSGCPRFLVLLLAYGLVLAVASGFSINSSFPAGATTFPYLSGSDGEGFYEEAIRITVVGLTNYSDVVTSNYAGFQIYLATWFSAFGAGLGVALVANNFLLLLSVMVLFKATELLVGSADAAMLACLAMMLTGSHIYYSLLLLKEPAIHLAFSLLLYSTGLALKQQSARLLSALTFSVAILILAATRGTQLLFVLVLLAALTPIFLRQCRASFAMAIGLLMVIAPLAQDFTTYELSAEFFFETTTQNSILRQTLEGGDVDVGGIVGRVSDAYLGLPFVVRTLLFVVPTSLQMLLPFEFWATDFVTDHSSRFFSTNANLVWLLFVGVWWLYAVIHVRRLPDTLLARIVLTGAFSYVIVAVIYGGAIPRYATPTLIFVYPAIGYWWNRSRQCHELHCHVSAFFRKYFGIFGSLIMVYLSFNLLRTL